jgi:uncharacterized membrane protein
MTILLVKGHKSIINLVPFTLFETHLRVAVISHLLDETNLVKLVFAILSQCPVLEINSLTKHPAVYGLVFMIRLCHAIASFIFEQRELLKQNAPFVLECLDVFIDANKPLVPNPKEPNGYKLVLTILSHRSISAHCLLMNDPISKLQIVTEVSSFCHIFSLGQAVRFLKRRIKCFSCKVTQRNSTAFSRYFCS